MAEEEAGATTTDAPHCAEPSAEEKQESPKNQNQNLSLTLCATTVYVFPKKVIRNLTKGAADDGPFSL